MDLLSKEDYSKVSSDDSEDGRSSSFEIEIERSKVMPATSEENLPRNVFIRRPAMNQVPNYIINKALKTFHLEKFLSFCRNLKLTKMTISENVFTLFCNLGKLIVGFALKFVNSILHENGFFTCLQPKPVISIE